MPTEAHGLTHPGAVRGNNEDAFAIGRELEMAVVSDGMGGANSGEIASALTIEAVLDYLRHPAEADLSLEERMKEAVRAANRRVRETAEARAECAGMGATIVIANWTGGRLRIVNVGDSRAYLWRDATLRQLSYDQNVGNDLRTTLGLTEEQVRKYPHHNVLTMAIGSAPEVLIRERQEEWRPGDLALLCSDGLSGPVDEAQLAAILAGGGPLEQTAAALIEAANRAGGPDNITAVLIRNTED